jgi:branched-chain amino acid transport system permease protein
MWRGQVVGAIAVLLAGLLPLFGSDYLVGFAFTLLLFVGMSYGWNLISGFTGYLSFGQISFFGVGAYSLALLVSRLSWPWTAAVLTGVAVAVALAVPLGWAMLRLRGPYFALGMLGLTQVLSMVASAWSSLTGGGEGIYLPPTASLVPLYYAAVAMVALGIIVTWLVDRSAFGLRLRAIGEDEVAAEAMGVNTTRAKLGAFVIASAFPALAGGLYAWRLSYIDPSSAFPAPYEVQTILMTIFGGAGTILGPLVGGFLFTAVGEALWARFPELHLLLFGSMILLVMRFMPEGVIPRMRRLALRRAGGTMPRPVPKEKVA